MSKNAYVENIFIKTGSPKNFDFLSKLEFVVGDFHIFWLREFVFERRYELWINLSREGFYLFYDFGQILHGISGVSLDLFVPCIIAILELSSSKDQRRSGNL